MRIRARTKWLDCIGSNGRVPKAASGVRVGHLMLDVDERTDVIEGNGQCRKIHGLESTNHICWDLPYLLCSLPYHTSPTPSHPTLASSVRALAVG